MLPFGALLRLCIVLKQIQIRYCSHLHVHICSPFFYKEKGVGTVLTEIADVKRDPSQQVCKPPCTSFLWFSSEEALGDSDDAADREQAAGILTSFEGTGRFYLYV